MTDSDFEVQSLKELRQLQKDVAKVFSRHKDRQKAEARAKIEAIAKEMGYSITDLVGVDAKASRLTAAAKHRQSQH